MIDIISRYEALNTVHTLQRICLQGLQYALQKMTRSQVVSWASAHKTGSMHIKFNQAGFHGCYHTGMIRNKIPMASGYTRAAGKWARYSCFWQNVLEDSVHVEPMQTVWPDAGTGAPFRLSKALHTDQHKSLSLNHELPSGSPEDVVPVLSGVCTTKTGLAGFLVGGERLVHVRPYIIDVDG